MVRMSRSTPDAPKKAASRPDAPAASRALKDSVTAVDP